MGWLIKVAVVTLEFLFAAGAIGSALVIVLSGIEDLETIFEGEEANSSAPDTSGT